MRTLGVDALQDEPKEQSVDHRSPAAEEAIAAEELHGDEGILMGRTILASEAIKGQAEAEGCKTTG